MKNFHAVCVDNFFDDPDKIREWGLGLSKQKDPEGKWPGKRSDQLHEVDDAFNQKLIDHTDIITIGSLLYWARKAGWRG